MALAENREDAQRDLFALLITAGQLLFTVGIIPLILILGPGGTGDVGTYIKFALYGTIAILGILTLFTLKGLQFLSFTGFGKDAQPIIRSFAGLNHDPESSLIGLISGKLARTIFGSQAVLAFGTIILFSLGIIFSANPIQTSQQFIGQSAIPTIDFAPGQLTQIGLSMFPAADAETLFVVAIASVVASLSILPLRNQERRAKLFIYLVTFLITVTLAGFIFHQSRYGSSDIAVLRVLQFWFVGGLVTILTGSNIPFRVLHFLNNLVVAIFAFLSSDVVVVFLGILIAFSILGLIVALVAQVTRTASGAGT